MGALVVAYAAFAVFALNWSWPYPRVLPAAVEYRGVHMARDSSAGCHPLSYWYGPRKPGNLPRGSVFALQPLTSALGFNRPRVFGYRARVIPWSFESVFVQNGGCYNVYYDTQEG